MTQRSKLKGSKLKGRMRVKNIINRITTKVYLILSCLSTVLLYQTLCSAVLPKEERVPGGVAVIELPDAFQQHKSPPSVWFEERPIALMREDSNPTSKWHAVVGLPLTLQPGMAHIVIQYGNQQQKLQFSVEDKQYLEERLHFKDKKHALPDPELQARIKREREHLDHVFGSWTNKPVPAFILHKPVHGRLSSDFGRKRIINGVTRSQHKGIDIAAPTGTPIKAAQAGVVEDVGDYFYTGKTVVLDHGQSFKTIYCHLDTVAVQQGQIITSQQRVGTVGQTGRATGPHLHFGVSLNNERVSPRLFLVN